MRCGRARWQPRSRIRFQCRKGAFNRMSVVFQEEVVPHTAHPMCSDTVIGDGTGLPGARLQTESGVRIWWQNLSVLSRVQSCAYDRAGLQQQRRVFIAENRRGHRPTGHRRCRWAKLHNGKGYTTLNYNKLVALLIPGVNNVSPRAKYLESRVTGQANVA